MKERKKQVETKNNEEEEEEEKENEKACIHQICNHLRHFHKHIIGHSTCGRYSASSPGPGPPMKGMCVRVGQLQTRHTQNTNNTAHKAEDVLINDKNRCQFFATVGSSMHSNATSGMAGYHRLPSFAMTSRCIRRCPANVSTSCRESRFVTRPAGR